VIRSLVSLYLSRVTATKALAYYSMEEKKYPQKFLYNIDSWWIEVSFLFERFLIDHHQIRQMAPPSPPR